MHNPLLPNIMFIYYYTKCTGINEEIQRLVRRIQSCTNITHYKIILRLQISRDNKIIKNSYQIVQTQMFNFTSKNFRPKRSQFSNGATFEALHTVL